MAEKGHTKMIVRLYIGNRYTAGVYQVPFVAAN